MAAAAAIVLLLGAGGVLLLTDDGPVGGPAADARPPTRSAVPDDRSTSGSEPSDSPTMPSDAGSEDSEESEDGPVDLARLAQATPPATAAPSRDVRGNSVRYEATNMLDGQADTAWRMPGDGTGQEIVFRLPSVTAITGVGLINGYAKVDSGYDGYTANRRILAVEWVFADGTVVPQDFTEDLTLQRVPVEAQAGDTVTLRILSVSEPAPGPNGRDYTAISDVALVGSPA